MSVRFMLALAVLLAPFWALAQSVSAPIGHDDPRFQRAVTMWLADDDANALAVFAMLARNENRAAQVMLGQIANRPKSPWLRDLPRASQKTLLLVPDDPATGALNQSWLDVAASGGDRLATLLK
jgi:hypothetical protein